MKADWEWEKELTALQAAAASAPVPSVNVIESENSRPWDVLVSTVISLRTRDEVTLKSSRKLLARAPSPGALLLLGEEETARLIYPAGFYRTKAANLIKIAGILTERFNGEVPAGKDELLALPGVGLKTANLVLGVGFGIPAICVDIHVHRIANRRGWIQTPNPDASEAALRKILPKKWWIDINSLLVSYGQTVCTPVSPWCSKCVLPGKCPRSGVERSR